MSRIVEYDIPCPVCKDIEKRTVYHSVNLIMTPDAVEMVSKDEINFFTCGSCSNRFQVKCSFLFVNNEKQYCLHYLPNGVDDESKSEVKKNLTRMFGDSFFLANPIEFDDWGSFKKEVIAREGVFTKNQVEDGKKFADYVFKRIGRGKTTHSGRGWSCGICDGDETTGCLYHDPTECPKFS